MESDHRRAGYKPAALPLSYVSGCPDLSTTRDQDGGFIISYMRKIRMRKKLNVLAISNSFMIYYNIFEADISDKTDKL